MATTEELEARIASLEHQQSVQTDALRALVEGNWTAAMPHAAALISSLYGAEGAPEPYTPQDYPPKE